MGGPVLQTVALPLPLEIAMAGNMPRRGGVILDGPGFIGSGPECLFWLCVDFGWIFLSW